MLTFYADHLPPETLLRDGPRIRVRISLPRAAANLRRQPPAPTEGLALIDTGASYTCIDQSVAAQLQLVPVGHIPVAGATSSGLQPVYVVTWELLGSNIPPLTDKSVVGASLANQGLSMLLGRDFLRIAQFTYDGVASTWSIAIPIATLPDVPTTSSTSSVPISDKERRRRLRKLARKAREKGRK